MADALTELTSRSAVHWPGPCSDRCDHAASLRPGCTARQYQPVARAGRESGTWPPGQATTDSEKPEVRVSIMPVVSTGMVVKATAPTGSGARVLVGP